MLCQVCARAAEFAQQLGRSATSWSQQAEELSRLAKGSSWAPACEGGRAEQKGEREEPEPGEGRVQPPDERTEQPAEEQDTRQEQEPEVKWCDGVVEIALPGVRAADMELSVSEEEVVLQAGVYALRLRACVDGASAKLRKGVLSLRLRT